MTRRRRRPFTFLACFALAGAAGCASRSSVPGATSGHASTPAPAPVLLDPAAPFWSTRAPDRFRVRIETDRGRFLVEVHRRWAPRGADRVWQLVRAGFYDDSRFFRVRAGFIAQFGIPGSPAGAALWRGRAIPDDTVRAPQSNVRGYIAYAMTGPGTRTTQLFVNLGDNARLDAQGFLPIGRVIRGMNVVDALYSGYGEEAGGGMRAGRQDSLFLAGNAWLDRRFPRLDRLVRARVVR